MTNAWRYASITAMSLLLTSGTFACTETASSNGPGDSNASPDPTPDMGQNPDQTPDMQADQTPDMSADAQPDTEADPTPDMQPESTPDMEAEPTPDMEADPTPDAEPDDEPYCDENDAEACDDNIDNDCDGEVDEGCTCTVAEKPCYSGDPRELEGNTACRAGTQVCEREFYGPCMNEILPSIEVCDGQDNDCNGEIDEVDGCNNTPPTAVCPEDQTGPTLAFYNLEGGYEDADGDAMVRAIWTIIDNPVGSTARPNPASGLSTEFFADVQGIYLFQLEVEDERGGIGRCVTRVETNSEDQLRIEMVWNVGASNDRSDVDLHILKTPQGRWFDARSNGDDCFFQNCRVCDEPYNQDPAQYEANCRQVIADFNADPNNSPPSQVEWFSPLDDNDPRLDLDDVEGNGPENINIKTPLNGTYRLGVHYYADDGFGDSTVTLRIFCRGSLAKEFEPVVLQEAPGADGGSSTEFWEVADIVWSNNSCEVREFGEPGCREICTRGQVGSQGCPDGLTRGQACD
jgi:hypothetical protein